MRNSRLGALTALALGLPFAAACGGTSSSGSARATSDTTSVTSHREVPESGHDAPPRPNTDPEERREAPPEMDPAALRALSGGESGASQRVTALPAPPDVAAAPATASRTPSGLASRVLHPGRGALHPRAQDRVTVHYTGWTPDGQMFDSSVLRGEPATFPLAHVIRGWSEGVQLMVEGEQRRLWIPSSLAYGDHPHSGAPAGPLVFDVELIGIEETREPPTTPPDVASPPADAARTASGLVTKVLSAGTGTVHPLRTSRVLVHYSGWTTDGQMFDSSVVRGEPAEFPLDGVIRGWTEGVQLMVEGERRRMWIPARLAYGEHPRYPGAPAGTLVFDVELIRIVSR